MTHHSASLHSPFVDDEGWMDLPITPLVIGDPRALVLGRRAALLSAAPMHAGAGANATAWRAALQRAANWPRHGQVLAGGLVAVLLVTMLLLALAALRTPPRLSSELPVRPASFTAPAVRVVTTAYAAALPVATAALPTEPEAAPKADASSAMPPLPFSPPPPAALALSATPAVPSAARVPAPRVRERMPPMAKVQVPVRQQPKAEEPLRAGVVLDEAEARAERGPPADASETLATSASVVPVTQSASLARAAGAGGAGRPVPEPASGLIAITPDSRFAVFTNPRTGLPQQFHIGDPLPGGDTIRSIDGGRGKVFTSGREYSLD